ncbi:MAG: hypothetical protein OIF35_04805, partial [Cellvibrionaceae bacterium]|nr:hypothetical protein [Cellvibrionaceae bacterium]
GVGSGTGVYRFNPEQGVLPMPAEVLAHPLLNRAVLTHIFSPKTDEIWALSRHDGVFVFDAQTAQLKRHIRHQTGELRGLGAKYLGDYLLDKAGLLWLAQQDFPFGLALYNPDGEYLRMLPSVPHHPSALSLAEVKYFYETENNYLIMGRGIEALAKASGQRSPLPQVLDQINRDLAGADLIWHGQSLPDNKLFIYTRGGKNYTIDLGANKYQSFQVPASCGYYTDALVLQDKRVAIPCAISSRLMLTPSDRWQPLEFSYEQPGKSAVRAYGMVELASGDLLVGTNAGLYRLSHAAISAGVGSLQRIAEAAVLKMAKSVSGDRVFVSTSQGIYQLRQRDNFKVLEQLTDNTRWSFKMVDDGRGRLWGDTGFVDLATAELTELAEKDGYAIADQGVYFADRDSAGNLVFTGSGAVFVLDSRQYKNWAYQPPLALSSLRIDDRPYGLSPNGSIDVPARSSHIALQVSALDYTAPLYNRYRYRLGLGRFHELDAQERIVNLAGLAP